MENQKLLTIAIPTFNRAEYLDISLNQLFKQMCGYENLIELIISNNASTDNTEEIVNKYEKLGLKIIHVKNEKNIGAELNVIQCFKLAKTKFVLILGDDDCFLDDALKKVIEILIKIKNKDCGLIYNRSFAYDKNFQKEKPYRINPKILVFQDKYEFIKKIGYFITFISGNIFNKSLYNKIYEFDDLFIGSELPHINWLLSVFINSKVNVFNEDFVIAGKSSESDIYRFCKIFATKLNQNFEYFIKRGIDKKFFKIINKKLLMRHFPIYFYLFNNTEINASLKENFWSELYPLYKYNIYFWIHTAPVIKNFLLARIFRKIVIILICSKNSIKNKC